MRIRCIKSPLLILMLGSVLTSAGPAALHSRADVKGLVDQHRYDEAISEAEQLLKGKNPSDHQDLLYELGRAYHNRGLMHSSFYEVGREVVKDYYEFLEVYDLGTCLPFYLGVCYFELGRYSQAIDEFDRLKDIKNLNKAYLQLSSVWTQASKFKLGQNGALRSLEEIKRENEANPVVVSEVACFLSDLAGKDKEALQWVQASKPPADSFRSRFHRNLAYIYMKNGMTDKVKETYALIKPGQEEFVAEINPELRIYFYDLSAMKVLGLLDYCLSDAALSQIMPEQVAPKRYHTVLNLRGQNAVYLGDYPGAAGFLEQSEHPVAGVYLGAAYYGLGRKAEAEAAWEKVEKSENAWALRELGRQYASLKGDPARGVDLCDSALGMMEGKPKDTKTRYYRYLGWVFLQNGQPDRADSVFNEGYSYSRANDLDYYEPEFLNERAFCFYQESELKWSEVIEAYFILQERYPAARQIHYAIQGLELGKREQGDVRP
jgi:tetratricopeptide (TPR) repeat protein